MSPARHFVTTVGRIIAANGAATMKRLSLELGGKSPMIVFDDADLDATVPVLAEAVTAFAGQSCMAGSRILAQRGVGGELRERLAVALGSVPVGPADDPSSEMGLMIERRTPTASLPPWSVRSDRRSRSSRVDGSPRARWRRAPSSDPPCWRSAAPYCGRGTPRRLRGEDAPTPPDQHAAPGRPFPGTAAPGARGGENR